MRIIHAVPGTDLTGLLVRKHQLTVLVFLLVYEYFHSISDLQIGIVSEFVE